MKPATAAQVSYALTLLQRAEYPKDTLPPYLRGTTISLRELEDWLKGLGRPTIGAMIDKLKRRVDGDDPTTDKAPSWMACEAASHELLAALTAAPWEELRPGVQRRTIRYYGVQVRQRGFVCQFCRGELTTDAMPMVKDRLWKATVHANGVSCCACFELRLGRSIGLADLRYCPLTISWMATNRPALLEDDQWKVWVQSRGRLPRAAQLRHP